MERELIKEYPIDSKDFWWDLQDPVTECLMPGLVEDPDKSSTDNTEEKPKVTWEELLTTFGYCGTNLEYLYNLPEDISLEEAYQYLLSVE